MNTTLIFLLTIIVIVFIWNIVLTVLVIKNKKKNDSFFEFGDSNIRELLENINKKNKEIIIKNSKIENDLNRIGDIIKNSYQKTGFLRYNPFKDTGGDQSFSLAILDLDNNGYIITSIHGREVNRVYAKQVVKGVSKHNLSAEETEALGRALK
jgi:hypothetical protein